MITYCHILLPIVALLKNSKIRGTGAGHQRGAPARGTGPGHRRDFRPGSLVERTRGAKIRVDAEIAFESQLLFDMPTALGD